MCSAPLRVRVGCTGASTLFAVTNGTTCAESLPYGPASISESSSPYLSSAHKQALHSQWYQHLTVSSGATLEIQWQFSDTKTLQDRFQAAVYSGERVTWTVTYEGATHTKTGTWWFSSAADGYSGGGMLSRFAGSGTNFSYDGGLWGGGTGEVDGYAYKDGTYNYMPSDFWGHGNFYSSDSGVCWTAYLGPTRSRVVRNLMYVRVHTSAPTGAGQTWSPTTSPTSSPTTAAQGACPGRLP